MHEFSLVKSIIDKTVEISRAHGERPVVGITIEVGALCQVVPELLQFAFQAASADTVAAHAALQLEAVALALACTKCGTRYQPEVMSWTCPLCGGTSASIVQGDDLILKSIELGDWPAEEAQQ